VSESISSLAALRSFERAARIASMTPAIADMSAAQPVTMATMFTHVMGAVHAASHVMGPTMPSTPRPFSDWNCRQTLADWGPYWSSTDIDHPLWDICACHVEVP
jgi:hypothetical protein